MTSKFDNQFMRLALVNGMRSDEDFKVGACVVNKDGKVIGMGYNNILFPVLHHKYCVARKTDAKNRYLFRIRNGWPLKSMRVTVPRAVRVGHSVTLECEYDLEKAPLYSVKWYRDSQEFYRYVPKEEPPTRVFPFPGLHVDVSVSNARKVTLLSVGRPLSGTFQCEVSADAPLFHTEMKAAEMTVAVVPDGVPNVAVDRAGLERGGPLIAECIAPPAYPSPNLTWYVNDQRVPGSTSSHVTTDADLLETASSKLELTGVGGSWGTIRLRCEATLFRLYRANSVEVEVKPDTPQPASVLLMGNSINGVKLPTIEINLLLAATVLLLLQRRHQWTS